MGRISWQRTGNGRKVGGQRLEEFGEVSRLKGEEGLGRSCEETVYHCPIIDGLVGEDQDCPWQTSTC